MRLRELVYVERDGAIAAVVLNRAEKLNALTRGMWASLGDTVERLSADDSLRCVIIRGAGEKSFSPGNDIAEFAHERSNKKQAIEYGKVMHRTADALANCRHPLIAQFMASASAAGSRSRPL